MWVTSISLPESREETQDPAGFQTETKKYFKGIPANKLDTTRNDELLANQGGYTADIIMEIESVAYSGQGYFIDEATGDIYDIRRTFHPNRSNRIKLTGELREHGKI